MAPRRKGGHRGTVQASGQAGADANIGTKAQSGGVVEQALQQAWRAPFIRIAVARNERIIALDFEPPGRRIDAQQMAGRKLLHVLEEGSVGVVGDRKSTRLN